ncbi:MAG: cadherin-like domain-containing protein, partial [Pseudomonadota bacterium]
TPNAEFEGEDTFTYTVSDGRGGETTANVSVTVERSSGELNPIDGGAGSEILVGGDGNDRIDGGGGTYDRLFGGLGEDVFVFGSEVDNGKRDRGAILDYEVGVDSILLEDGAQIASSRESGGRVFLQLEGDGDLITVQGDEPLTLAGLTIEQDPFSVF